MEYQYFNNQKFCKYPGNVYWQNTSTTERMHRYVWEFYNGKIPVGYEVHHIDHNVDNNDISNLKLLTRAEHQRIHSEERTPEQLKAKQKIMDHAREYANKWHGSAQGHEWHKAQYESTKDRLFQIKTFTCQVCGEKFQSKKYEAKFCCPAPRAKYRRLMGLDCIVKTCPFCGKEFKTNRFKPSQTCSRNCGNALRKNKKNNSISE